MFSIKNTEVSSRELDLYWFPVDQWISEMLEPRIHVPRLELSRTTSEVVTGFILTGNVLLTLTQTQKQIHKLFFS